MFNHNSFQIYKGEFGYSEQHHGTMKCVPILIPRTSFECFSQLYLYTRISKRNRKCLMIFIKLNISTSFGIAWTSSLAKRIH